MNSARFAPPTFLFFFVVVVVVATGCANLPQVAAGTCGNHVVEPPEDCDGFAPNETSLCRPKGTAGECRLDCRLQADGSRPSCPSGWGCDRDGVCLPPTGAYERTAESNAAGAWALMAGDFDGDGRADVVSMEPTDARGRTRLSFHYFDENATVVDTRRFPRLLASPVISDVSGDGRSDVVFTDFSAGVLLGQADRGTVPETFSSYHFPGSSIRMAVVFDMPIQDISAVVALATIAGAPGLYVPDQSGILRLRGDLNVDSVEDLAGGQPVSGDIIEGTTASPCREVILAGQGATSFSMTDTCSRDPLTAQVIWRDAFQQRTVMLDPPAPIDGPAQVADMDGDGHMDVLLSAAGQPYVAYGNGLGLAAAVPYHLHAANPGDLPPDFPMPLAAGDFTGDGVVDFVFDDHLLVSGPAPSGSLPNYRVTQPNEAARWTVARIADLNGNGKLDVVAASSQRAGIDFFNGNGTENLLVFHLPTTGLVTFLEVGDFDGDLVNDLAFVVAASSASERDSLMVAFGAPAGAPVAAIPVARVAHIEQLGVLPEVGIGNLLVTSTELVADVKSGVLAVLSGSTDRLPIAPYQLVSVSPDRSVFVSAALTLAVGGFTTGRPGAATDTRRDDVLALTSDGNPSMFDFHFWLLPAVDAPGSAAVPIGGELDRRLRPASIEAYHINVTVFGAAADVDGDGRDEAIWAMPADPGTGEGSGCGVVVVEVSDAPGGSFLAVPREPIIVDQSCAGAQILPVDADGDGAVDVALLTGGPGSTQRQLMLLWNDGQGGFAASRASLVSAAGHSPQQFTVPPVTAEGIFRMAYVTDQTVSIVSATEPGARSFGAPALLAEVRRGSGIVAADVDGDGIVDLALAADGNLSVLRAQLRAP